MTHISEPRNPTGVYFYAKLGGGHRTAKEAIQKQHEKVVQTCGQKLEAEDVDIGGERVLNAVQLPFIGGLGDIGTNAWNDAQRRGDLKFLEWFASWGWLGEIIFYPLVYFRVKWLLESMEFEPQYIVSTQAFCLNAIVHAMHTVNHEKGWNMRMDLYLTDMPTKRATHFFPSIRKVADNDDLRDLVTLHAPPPIAKGNQTSEEFWEKYCGKIKVISNENYPIREAFLDTGKLKARLNSPTVDIKLKLNNPHEAEVIKKGLSREASFDETSATLQINEIDKLAFLMLGSQPTTKSVLEWLDTFAAESKSGIESARQHYLFLYCGAPENDDNPENPLWRGVSERLDQLKSEGKLAPNFNVVPFTNQDAGEIALLMARSDISITRSGGATSMELLELYQADLPKRKNKLVLINSEATLGRETSTLHQDPAELAKMVQDEIAKNMAGKQIATSPAWDNVKEQMIEFCRKQGCSESDSNTIVENVLNLYVYNDAASLDALFKMMDEQAHMLSRDTRTENEKIEERMHKMQQKDKYQGYTLVALRALAIEQLLIKEGIVLWEAGNAKYLAKKMDAHVTNPRYAQMMLRTSFFT